MGDAEIAQVIGDLASIVEREASVQLYSIRCGRNHLRLRDRNPPERYNLSVAHCYLFGCQPLFESNAWTGNGATRKICRVQCYQENHIRRVPPGTEWERILPSTRRMQAA